MATPLELRKLSAYRQQIRGEGLEDLSFKDAFPMCLDLMELCFDMVESMTSPAELIRIQNQGPAVRNSRHVRRHRRSSRAHAAKEH